MQADNSGFHPEGVSQMTTTLERPSTQVVERPPTPVAERIDHTELETMWKVTPPVEEPKPKPWRKVLAVGVLSGLAGLAAGYGVATWQASDEIARLEAQQSITMTAPYGGFQNGYSAVREHQALAENMAVPPTSEFYTAPNDTTGAPLGDRVPSPYGPEFGVYGAEVSNATVGPQVPTVLLP
jgi:hypothetical protein